MANIASFCMCYPLLWICIFVTATVTTFRSFHSDHSNFVTPLVLRCGNIISIMLHSVGVGNGRTYVTWASGRKLEASHTSKEFVLTLVPDLIRNENITVVEYVVTTPWYFVTPVLCVTVYLVTVYLHACTLLPRPSTLMCAFLLPRTITTFWPFLFCYPLVCPRLQLVEHRTRPWGWHRDRWGTQD